MIYTPSTDIGPLKLLLTNLKVEMPEGTSFTWVRVKNAGVEVSFYYQSQTDGTYAYRAVTTANKPIEFAKLLSETFGVEFNFIAEIVMRFDHNELATVHFEREITEANINVINYKLGLENEKQNNAVV